MERKGNIDFLRIISIVMILIYHALYHGNVLNNSDFSNISLINKILYSLFINFGNIGNAIFFIIAGFYCSEKVRYCSLRKIFVFCLFYLFITFVINTVFSFIYPVDYKITLRDLLKILIPISSQEYWFITVYFFLQFIGSYFYKGFYSLTEKKRIYILIYIFIAYVLTSVLQTPYQLINRGLFYFTLGALCQKNTSKINIKLLFSLSILLLGCILYITFFSLFNTVPIFIEKLRNALIIPLFSIVCFKLFDEITFDSSKILYNLSKASLGAYLFHDSPFFRPIYASLSSKYIKLEETSFIFRILIIVLLFYCFIVLLFYWI